jgi:DNA-binding GntR family transcriptional regulator
MPVREAIRRLEAEHWVAYQRTAGARVAPRDADSWAEAIEALGLLEGFVTATAAPFIVDADLAQMRAVDELMLEDVEQLDVLALTEHNEAFHRVIWDRCPNRILRREVELAAQRLNAMRSTIYFPMSGRGRSSIEEHEELIAMLEAHVSSDDLERFAREHRLKTIAAQARRSEQPIG